ncbi:MAG: adenylate/guanylate cyclase domain-containing protein [Bacteroidia bacterium]|nr:adenylate/guanylate cyclase domain-containing protein [Bacteroidia bacterium]
MSYTRKLASIMFTDIVGYTKLMQTSESAAIKLRNRHREVFDSFHESYRGRIIQYYGDGTLSIFESAVDAVRCAIEIQRKLRKEPEVPLRIGIHLGDILLSDTDIIGNSVNLAARVESLGVAGAVLVSNKVMEEIKNQDDIPCQLMGNYHFKNDSHPRNIYAISASGLLLPSTDQLSGKLEASSQKKEIESLAVLPFDNFTGEKDQDYLVGGIHDNLITALSQISSLRVISKTSTLRYKNSNKSIPDIAKELNVDAIVEASVSKIKDKIQLNVQLIRAFPEENHIWADIFDRSLDSIYSLLNEITKTISEKINLVLTPKEAESLSHSPKVDPQAYQTYLRGMFHWEKLSAKDFEIAKEYFEKAIAIDPSFAPPYAAIAHTLIGQVQMGLIAPPEAMPKIYQYNMKALRLNFNFSESHYMNAILSYVVEWDWEKSEAEFIKSLDGNPNHSLSHAYYGHLLMILNRFEEAISEVNISLKLDPNNPLVQSLAGVVFFHSGDTQRAFSLVNKSHQIDPNNILNYRFLESCYVEFEEYDNAFEMQKKINYSDPQACQALDEGYANKDYSQAMLALAQSREELSKKQFVQPVWVALAYLKAGLNEKVIQWLEQAFQMHDQDLPYVFIAKEFAPFMQDQRFIQIAKKMNLPIGNISLKK